MKNLFIIFNVIWLNAEVKSGIIGEKAPAISLLRMDNNKFFRSETLLGKRHIVLCFFATWSVASALEIPKLQEIEAGINNKDISFFLVNVRETINTVSQFVHDKIYTFPVLMDRHGLTLKRFYGTQLPLIIVINRDGIVTYQQIGYKDNNELQLIAHLKTL